MAQRGKPSTAHEYDKRLDSCIHCGMYRSNVEKLIHVCIPEREKWADSQITEGPKPTLIGRLFGGEAKDGK